MIVYHGWIELGKISGNGNSNNIIYYSTIDKNPLSGLSYYRLTQFDYDSRHKSFPIKSCWFDNNEKIYPNPANEYIIIPNDDAIIYNTYGTVIIRTKKGENNITKLSSGLYFIKLSTGTLLTFIKQ